MIIQEGTNKMAYCDTNILTSFVNKQNLSKIFGNYGYNKFSGNIRGLESKSAIEKSKNINNCVISRDVLLKDIGKHEPSLGAVMTFVGLKNVEIKKNDGLKTGKKYFDMVCKKTEDKEFKNNFCDGNNLKHDLNYNKTNDVSHFGSAVELGEKIFITDNVKDFKPLEEVSNIKIE